MGDQGVQGDLDPGRDRSTQVVAIGVDRVVGDRRSEVDHDHRAAVLGVRGKRVRDPVGANILRVVVADSDAGLDPGANHHRLALEVPARSLNQGGIDGWDDARDDDASDDVQLETAELEQLAQLHGHLVGGLFPARRDAPVRGEAVPVE